MKKVCLLLTAIIALGCTKSDPTYLRNPATGDIMNCGNRTTMKGGEWMDAGRHDALRRESDCIEEYVAEGYEFIAKKVYGDEQPQTLDQAEMEEERQLKEEAIEAGRDEEEVASITQPRSFINGHKLWQWCKLGSSFEEKQACLAYVTGVNDYHLSLQNGGVIRKVICPPVNVSNRSMVMAVTRFLQESPMQREERADLLVTFAIAQKYPCEAS
jgi:hypothetical protein